MRKTIPPTPTSTELCAALVPLAGQEVRATVLDEHGQPLAALHGNFRGSCDPEPLAERLITLNVAGGLIEIRLDELRWVSSYRQQEFAGLPLSIYGVSIVMASGVSIEIEDDVDALFSKLYS
jgi:hypothetical protein